MYANEFLRKYKMILAIFVVYCLFVFSFSHMFITSLATNKAIMYQRQMIDKSVNDLDRLLSDLNVISINMTFNSTLQRYLAAPRESRKSMSERHSLRYEIVGASLHNPNILGILIYDNDFFNVIETGEVTELRNVKYILSNNSYRYSSVQIPQHRHALRRPFFYIINEIPSAIYFNQDTIRGYSIVMVDTEAINRIVSGLGTEQNHVFLVVDSTSNIIGSSNRSYVGAGLSNIMALYSNAQGGWDNDNYLIDHRTISSTDWVIMSIMPRRYILQDYRIFIVLHQVTSAFFVVLFLFGAVKFAKDSVKQIRQNYELKICSQQVELQMLHNRLNPHFLYNTLEQIRGMAYYYKANKLANIIYSLSRLMRYSTRPDIMGSLKDEIEIVRAYDDIIKERFGKKIKIVYHVDDEILHKMIPRMMLQTLVENAVIHGLESKVDGGQIILEACEKDDYLQISVSDDGNGMDEGVLEKVNCLIKNHELSTGGIGLFSLIKRLYILYGQDCVIIVNSQKNEGTSICFLIKRQVLTDD